MQRKITIGKADFSPESQRKQLEESIDYWQKAGPRAIWDATSEITAEWFLLRGIDPSTQRVDKTISGILPVPWSKSESREKNSVDGDPAGLLSSGDEAKKGR